MMLTAGTRVGPYEVTSPLGEGGMGVVYRAHDTKLRRDVALKLLPDHFADNPDRLSWFQREAQVLAALNHPNIAQIYGLEESNNTKCIVMEFVEGETLAERLRRGPIPVRDALQIAAQIASALEAAHEKTIIHRDLKPANIKLTPDGNVKLLDFGLAKVFDNTARQDPANYPTLSVTPTNAGAIVGTPAYMSPEQAAGKPFDKRSDIWSYGVVLFEMMTGERLFGGGETLSHTLADVLRAPIDFTRLPTDTPAAIRDLLRRCLDRDVKNRLRDIGEARIAIENAERTPEAPMTAAPSYFSSVPWIVATTGLIIVAVISIFSWWRATRPVEHPLMRLMHDVGTQVFLNSGIGPAIAISPDGLRLAYISESSDGQTQLSLRSLGSSKSIVLVGADGDPVSAPFFSADGQWVAFFPV
jgi:serine/threonine-protein kinase